MRQTEQLWEMLLEVKKLISLYGSDLTLLSVIFDEKSFITEVNSIKKNLSERRIVISSFPDIPEKPNRTFFLIHPDLKISVIYNHALSKSQLEFFSWFLPLCFFPLKAAKSKKAVSVLHLAQSLDGKIATVSGNSKWISSNENLVFVHRLRALCDGILIGAKTLNRDNPALTVRYVKGANPVKIVLGNSADHFINITKGPERILHLVSRKDIAHEHTDTICMEEHDHSISPSTILEELYRQGISSVYIEGGAHTASHFLDEKAVNLLYIYIAPKIFGSGIGIELPEIDRVDDCICFTGSTFYPMGEGVLLQGFIQ